jgi:hypothetical protein
MRKWLPNPPDGTPICLGFDGSLNNDWTALQAETMTGYSFSPLWGPNAEPTYWNPAEHGSRIPHGLVADAIDELHSRFVIVRQYCDPHDWESDIEDWALRYGKERVITWETNRITPMHAEIVRFENDLREGRITHDGDPTAALHVGNAKKVGKPGQKFILGKPNENQKIDIAMAKILAHTAVRDSLAGGWEPPKPRSKMRVYR